MLSSPQIRYDGPVGKAELGRGWAERMPAKQDTAGAFALTDGKKTKPAQRAGSAAMSATPEQPFKANEELSKEAAGFLDKIFGRKTPAAAPIKPSAVANGTPLDPAAAKAIRFALTLEKNEPLYNETTLKDLNTDDLDFVESVLALEDAYGTRLPEDKEPVDYSPMTLGALNTLIKSAPKRNAAFWKSKQLPPVNEFLRKTSTAAINFIVKDAAFEAAPARPWRAALLSALAGGGLSGGATAALNARNREMPWGVVGGAAGAGALLSGVMGYTGALSDYQNNVATADYLNSLAAGEPSQAPDEAAIKPKKKAKPKQLKKESRAALAVILGTIR